ncbi:MAG: DUF4968 domain-containing protein, partial [Parasporobacterium sp.]|nr:DUF4968 domain-containing protein [Parasporobacterium sp.]
MIRIEAQKLIYQYDSETLLIEAWGENAVRVRATKCAKMPDENWALSIPQDAKAVIEKTADGAILTNGKMTVKLSDGGKIRIYHENGKMLLEEYWRNRRDITDPKCSAIEVEGREFKPIPGGDYHLSVRFESLDPNEKIYGMGQYQQKYLNLKGTDLELAHRNSQA